MARADEQTNVRLPRDLKEWLLVRASENRRSLTSEIVSRLEQTRTAQPKKGTP